MPINIKKGVRISKFVTPIAIVNFNAIPSFSRAKFLRIITDYYGAPIEKQTIQG